MRRVSADAVLSLDPEAGRPRRRWVPPRWWRPAMRTLKVTAALIIGAGVPAWAWSSGVAVEVAANARAGFIHYSADFGLRVDDVLVEGRSHTRPADLLFALQVERGDPILGVDLVAARDRVETLPWVSEATVERRLPGLLKLRIVERKPIALWQNQGEFILVDAAGTAIPDDLDGVDDLPLVVGEDAPQHAAELIRMMTGEPQLMRRVKAAVRVSGRRWNLVIDSLDGIHIRLPEENAGAAWQRLAKLEREHRLLNRAITVVDLRLPDRLVVRRDGANEPVQPPPRRKPGGKDA